MKLGGAIVIDHTQQQKLRHFVKLQTLFFNLQGILIVLKHSFIGLCMMLELYHLAEQLS